MAVLLPSASRRRLGLQVPSLLSKQLIVPVFLLVLLALAFLVFFLIADRFAEIFAFVHMKGPLGSDTREGAEMMLKLKYEWKHPLAGAVLWLATEPFTYLPGLAPDDAL